MPQSVPARQRVLEVIADLGEGRTPRRRFGSGLLVGGRHVLTCAHVVVDAVEVKVRGPDKLLMQAVLERAFIGVPDSKGLDLALLDVPDADDLPHVPVALVSRDSGITAFIEGCGAVGYPKFEEVSRDNSGVTMRETAHVGGRIAPLSGLVEELLSLEVTSKPTESPPLPPAGTTLGDSSWSGMSGAAVFAPYGRGSGAEVLVGVVTEHAPRRGQSDITILPLDRLISEATAPPNAGEWWARLGVTDPQQLQYVSPIARRIGRLAATGLPAIWNLPHFRNPNFSGRAELLDQLEEDLATGRPVALAGLGGVGKTQLATEYAYRYLTDYDLVWWVRAEDPATLAADYALLAGELDLPEQSESDLAVVVAAVRRWLRQQPRWLVVFDNARTPAEIRPYLPGGSGHVVITSRNPAWGALAQSLAVVVWSAEEAAAFLLKRTGHTDQAGATSLADALGYLPLALEHAAAYIENSPQAFATYLDLFRQRRRDVLGWKPPDSVYPDAVATTWDLAFQEVQATAPAGVDLLRLGAFLAPGAIPLAVIHDGVAQLPPDSALAAVVGDAWQWNEAIAQVRRYSVMEITEDVISVHRLVQAVVRDHLSQEDMRTWAQAAVRLVTAAFPFDSREVQMWPSCAHLLPHALSAAGHVEALQVVDATTGRLLNQVGLYLWARGQLPDAKKAQKRALVIGEKVFGPDHPITATALNNLGMLLTEQGDLADARPYLERALAILEKVLGRDHPDTANSLNSLGMLLQDQGDLAGARPYLERALAINEKVLGPDHPITATALNNLGMLLTEQGDLADARPYLERALAIDERVLGSDHPDTALRLGNLGEILQAEGDLAGARPYLERALAIHEKVLGPDHPITATSMSKLSALLQSQGDLAGARPYLERALAIFEKVLGPDHPNTATSLTHLGSLLHTQSDLTGARLYLERALAIREKVLGPDHPDTATSQVWVGFLLQAQGDAAGARGLYERALASRERLLGPDHPNTLLVRRHLQSLGN